MKVRCLTILFLLATLSLASSAEAALSYDLSADYSLANNPNGAWTFGSCAIGQPLSTFTQFTQTGAIGDIDGWIADADPNWCDPNVSYNPADTEVVLFDNYHWAAHGVGLGSNGIGSAVVRWTCQEDGVYDVVATFTGTLSTGNTSVWLVALDANASEWLMPAERHGYGESQTYTGQLTLVAGQTLDFVNYDGWQYTGLSATINQVPEPSTFVLMAFGLLGAIAYMRRSR
jgi:hypothetical protein